MRFSVLTAALLLLFALPVYAQDDQPVPQYEFVPVEPVFDTPQFEPAETIDIPDLNLPPAARKTLKNRKSTLTKAHIKAIDQAEQDILKTIQEFDALYPPFSSQNAHLTKRHPTFYEDSKAECKKYEAQGIGYDCWGGEPHIMKLWQNSSENKANAYSFPKISHKDIVTITGSWVSPYGDVITISANKKGRDQFSQYERRVKEQYEIFEAAISEAGMRAVPKASQKKGWFSKPLPSIEEITEREKTLREQHFDRFHSKHSDLRTTFVGGVNTLEGYNFTPYPGDHMEQIKAADNATSLSITHIINGVEIIYDEAWFNGFGTVAKGKLKQEYLANDNLDPQTQGELEGADFWLTCNGWRYEHHEMGSMQHETHRIPCSVWVPVPHQIFYTNNNRGGTKKIVNEIGPYYRKTGTFYLHKTDLSAQDITITKSAYGAHDDDLP